MIVYASIAKRCETDPISGGHNWSDHEYQKTNEIEPNKHIITVNDRNEIMTAYFRTNNFDRISKNGVNLNVL